MLRVRILSAVVLLPIVLGLLWLGGWWFFVLVLMGLTVAGWELVAMMRIGDRALWLPAVLTLVWIPALDFKLEDASILVPALSVVILLGLVWSMRTFSRGAQDPTAEWGLTLAGGLYLGLLGSHFVRLRDMDDGLLWSAITYGSTWLADSGAYFTGRQWGKRKLAPKLSPGKTVEGVIGGVVVAVLGATLLSLLLGLAPWYGALLGALVALLSPLGDLGVSMIKRQVGAKDSGKLIPGHGGVLDRIDSLLVGVVVGTYFVMWVVQ